MFQSGFKGFFIWVVSLVAIAWILASEPSPELVFGLYSPKRFLVLVVAGYSLAWALYIWLGAESFKEKSVRCGLTSCTLLILLTVIESTAFLGLVDYTGISPEGGSIPVGYQSLNPRWWRADPELIHIRHPYQQIRGRTSGDIYSVPESAKRAYQIVANYDANGFRNSSDLVRASVVLIGDSFLEAGLVLEQATAASLLQQELGISVANLGITMYGPQQELAALRRYGLPLEPRVVMWFFFEGNDVFDAIHYKDRRLAIKKGFDTYSGYYQRSFLRNVSKLLIRWISTYQVAANERFTKSCDVGEGDETSRLYFRYGPLALAAATSDGLEKAKRVIAEANSLTTKVGAHFTLVYVPTKFRVYRGRCTDPVKATFPPEGQIDDLRELMEEWSEELGMPFLDLTPALQTRATGNALLYFSDDSHWTGEGHQVVGEAVLEFLEASGWLDRE